MMPSPSSIDVDKCKISPIYISVHLFWGISVDFNSLFLKLKSLFSYWKVRQALPIFLHVPTYPINEKSSSFRCDLLTSFINLQNKVSRANHSQFYFWSVHCLTLWFSNKADQFLVSYNKWIILEEVLYMSSTFFIINLDLLFIQQSHYKELNFIIKIKIIIGRIAWMYFCMPPL